MCVCVCAILTICWHSHFFGVCLGDLRSLFASVVCLVCALFVHSVALVALCELCVLWYCGLFIGAVAERDPTNDHQFFIDLRSDQTCKLHRSSSRLPSYLFLFASLQFVTACLCVLSCPLYFHKRIVCVNNRAQFSSHSNLWNSLEDWVVCLFRKSVVKWTNYAKIYKNSFFPPKQFPECLFKQCNFLHNFFVIFGFCCCLLFCLCSCRWVCWFTMKLIIFRFLPEDSNFFSKIFWLKSRWVYCEKKKTRLKVI